MKKYISEESDFTFGRTYCMIEPKIDKELNINPWEEIIRLMYYDGPLSGIVLYEGKHFYMHILEAEGSDDSIELGPDLTRYYGIFEMTPEQEAFYFAEDARFKAWDNARTVRYGEPGYAPFEQDSKKDDEICQDIILNNKMIGWTQL